MRYRKWMAWICAACIGLTACGNGTLSNFQQTKMRAGTYDPMQAKLAARCEKIVSIYRPLYEVLDGAAPSQNDIDEMEALLIDEGLDVIDTDGVYPSCLVNADRFHGFWNAVRDGKQAEQEVIRLTASGALAYQLFTYDETGGFLYSMTYPLDGEDKAYEAHDIKDWELTEKGNFFYRILPENDKHYPDFSLIRLTPPDPELYDMTRKYIFAAGYTAVNMFLIDWSEGSWGDLSFNDQFEYLYRTRFGKAFSGDGNPMLEDRYGYAIPAGEFEAALLPYYNIDLAAFRELAQYDPGGDCYPWRPLETEDFVLLWYYSIEPEVTAYTQNADGTLTLAVEALSTDLKTDCLFAHEVTVRPLENGEFQYVGNRVTYQTEYGLPYTVPRLRWEA